jgi:hypothetical protein
LSLIFISRESFIDYSEKEFQPTLNNQKNLVSDRENFLMKKELLLNQISALERQISYDSQDIERV